MGHLALRLLVPTLLAALALPAAETPPMMELQLSDGARMIQRWEASLYAKLWNERALEPLRARVAENLNGLEGSLGFTIRDLLTAMRTSDVRITELIAPKADVLSEQPAQPKARLLAQFEFGAFAGRLMDLMSAANPNAEVLTLAGADAAIRPLPNGNPAIDHMTIARFGERLVIEANREEPPAPIAITPSDADLRFTIDYRSFIASAAASTKDAKQQKTFATIRSFDQFLEPLTWEMSLVPEGIHERMSQAIAYPGALPVDRSVFSHLPATTLMAMAMGFDSKAYWTVIEPVVLKILADQGTAMTTAQLFAQLEQGLAAQGMPLTADQVVNGVKGTVLVAITTAAPFPAVTIAVPRSPALDQLIRTGVSLALHVDAPADGTSAQLPIPNLPLPVTLVADAKYWVVTSDQTLASAWSGGTAGGTAGGTTWGDSPALKLALEKATPDAFLIGASDTPAVLRTLGGFLPLLPIQDAKDKQMATVLLARAAGWAATGFLVGQPRGGGWEMEARGLLGLGAVPAIIAGIAVPNLLKTRAAASEVSVVGLLRSGVFPAEIQFQAGAYVDQNGDNIGEFGFLAEMAGGPITGQPDTMKLALLPAAWNAAQPTVHGYRFACWLPDGKGGAIAGTDGLRAQNPAAAKAQSERFVVYAWSAEEAGKPVYALTQSGSIYASSQVEVGANGPAWNAVFGGGAWDAAPAWEPYRRR